VIHNGIMLPDSTSDEAGSHGFIKFSMLPRTDLTAGATISNIAHIVFDFNEPIITPPALFSVDVLARIPENSEYGIHVYPNPVKDKLRIELSKIAGIVNYEVRDMLGKLILQDRTNASAWIEVSALDPGVYTLTIQRENSVFSDRFLKE